MSDENLEIDTRIEDINVSIEDDKSTTKTLPHDVEPLDYGDEDVETRRKKGREERLTRSQRQRQARMRKDEQLDELNKQIEELRERDAYNKSELAKFQKTAAQWQSSSLQDKISETEKILRWYEEQRQEAYASGDFAKVGQIDKVIQEESTKRSTLEREKDEYKKTSENINPAIFLQEEKRLSLQRKWLQKNDWWGRPEYSEEQQAITAIDESLHREGWNSTTPEYWRELDRRVKSSEYGYMLSDDEYTPPPTKQNKQPPVKQEPVVAGSGGASGSTAGTTVRMRFNANQQEVLRHQGLLDDNNQPVKGKEADIKYYYNFWNKQK